MRKKIPKFTTAQNFPGQLIVTGNTFVDYPTCATCKHHNMTLCRRITLGVVGDQEMAEISDDSPHDDYEAEVSLRTALNFGCVLHEEKEE